MKYVNLFFHIYQPPTQDPEVLAEIVEQSYRPLTEHFVAFDRLRFTLNINYSLFELLDRCGFTEIIDNIRKAYDRGTLELTTTGAYHPIFPLIPEEEVIRQLDINEQGIRRYIPSFKPDGVFPPEMAFEGGLVSLFQSRGYRWTIVDDSNLKHYVERIPYDRIYSFDDLAVFLRSNAWSNQFGRHRGQWNRGRDAVNDIKAGLDHWMKEDDGYLIIALDGETFGYHYPGLDQRFLGDLFEAFGNSEPELQLSHIMQLPARFPLVPAFIAPGSWSTDEPDLLRRDYFSWWKSPGNEVHRLQWEFTDFVLEKVRKIDDDELAAEMDRALYSCQYWWASYWKFNANEVYRGAFNMMRTLQKAADHLGDDYDDIKEGEAIFRQLITEVEREKYRREH